LARHAFGPRPDIVEQRPQVGNAIRRVTIRHARHDGPIAGRKVAAFGLLFQDLKEPLLLVGRAEVGHERGGRRPGIERGARRFQVAVGCGRGRFRQRMIGPLNQPFGKLQGKRLLQLEGIGQALVNTRAVGTGAQITDELLVIKLCGNLKGWKQRLH
jgi:hypothetical protein